MQVLLAVKRGEKSKHGECDVRFYPRDRQRGSIRAKAKTHKAEALSTEWKTMEISIADSPAVCIHSGAVRRRRRCGANARDAPGFTFTLSTHLSS